MVDELIDICDESNNLLNIQKTKKEAHRNGLWHRATHIWIYNSKGEILLQLRSKEKSLYPDAWDISVAGHISAGEDPLTSALREIKEEIGLNVKSEDLELFKVRKVMIVYNKLKNNEFNYVYFLKFDGDIKKLKLQKGEVQEIRFFTPKELENEIIKKPDKYAPHLDYVLEIINEIKRRANIK
jgi:isopentenyl-diphosphate delta-isomerase